MDHRPGVSTREASILVQTKAQEHADRWRRFLSDDNVLFVHSPDGAADTGIGRHARRIGQPKQKCQILGSNRRGRELERGEDKLIATVGRLGGGD